MNNRLSGADISHYNGVDAVDRILAKDSSIEFFIIKTTEGKTWIDPNLKNNVVAALKRNKRIGLYHYARPENNTPAEEASHFITTINSLGIRGGSYLMALDYEGTAHYYGESWAKMFLDLVYAATGVKPLIYLSESYVPKYGTICGGDYGLWIANRNKDNFKPAPWYTAAIWQYSVKNGYDHNYFNGGTVQWDKYCKPDTNHDDTETDSDTAGFCGCTCCQH